MGVNWKQILGFGKMAAQMFLPQAVNAAIELIEDKVAEMVAGGKTGWSGPEKQQAALETALASIAIVEGVSGKDLLDDAAVAAAGRKAIDAAHAAKVAQAELFAAIQAFKQVKAQPVAAPDATGQP